MTLDNLETSSCGYAGVRVAGDRVIVKYMTSALNVVGIFITSTADLGVYERNTLRDNNRMNVNTPSPANDDSGAFGFLVQGDSNELKNNVITGSDAFSYDYGRDGCAIEIFGASGTNAHDNTATSNNCFVELGKPATDPSSANNRFTYNVISSSERGTQSPKEGSEASALITRGANDSFGPVTGTVFSNNKVTLSGAGSAKGKVSGIVCYGGCSSALARTAWQLRARLGNQQLDRMGGQGFRQLRLEYLFPRLPDQPRAGSLRHRGCPVAVL